MDEEHLRLAEAVLFAAAGPVTPRELAGLLPEDADADAVLAMLAERYTGRGVELVPAGAGWMLRTAPDLAERLRRIVPAPRRLSRVVLETLAIIAWHQPVTRAEIERERGAALSQSTMDALLEEGLIASRGKKDAPGQPTLWGTTDKFLTTFSLRDLTDLPRREELLLDRLAPTSQATS